MNGARETDRAYLPGTGKGQGAAETGWTATFSPAKDVYGQTLVQLIAEGKPVVVVEADLLRASGGALVQEAYPDRVLQVGIAEQNAVGIGAGLAAGGLIPFVNTFAVTLSRRAADQVWQAVAFNNMNVKLNGMYSGFTAEANGPTHQSLEDLAVMRAFPRMVVLEPADCRELTEAVRAAADHVGPVYLRNVRITLPDVLDPDQPPFEIGKAAVLRPGDDVTILASGIMVQFALQAHDILRAEGLGARVVSLRTIKPLDRELILRCARETRAVVTVEDHGVIGGVGSAVAELLGEAYPTPMRRIGVKDRFGDAGTFQELMAAHEMDVPHIVAAARELAGMRPRLK